MSLNLKSELKRLAGNDVPWLGFGTAEIGTAGERETSSRLLNEAFEQGIRYFDTARLYGGGEAEHVIGEVLGGKRDQILLTSKAGIIPWTDRRLLRVQNKLRSTMGMPPLAVDNLFGAFSLKQLKASFDRSLKALRTDYLDCLLLHESAREDALNEDIVAWAQSLKDAGKIRAFGCAATEDETDRILGAEARHLDIVQYALDVSKAPKGNDLDHQPQVITHSALTEALGAIARHLEHNPALALEIDQTFGVDLADTGQLAPHLLLHNHRQTDEAPVLFSTSKPERIAKTVLSVSAATGSDPEAMRRVQAAISG